MKTGIAKNAAFMTMASVGQKLVAFVYFTLIARHIGVVGTGKYFFALSFTTIFVVFVDLGLTNVLVRESAKLKTKIQAYFSTILSVKIVLAGLSYIGVVVLINIMGYPVETRQLVYLSAVTMLFDSLHLSIYGVLRSIGNLKYEAISIVGSQAISLVLGTIFLYLDFPIIFLILAITITSFFNVCYATFVLYKKYQIKLLPKYDPEIFKYIGKIAIPFALAAIFARVYSYIDSILLSKLAGDIAVGWYAIPYKITYAFQFVPLALVATMYPRFSEYFAYDKAKLSFIFERGIKYLLIIAIPIAVGIAILSEDIIIKLYTEEYRASIFPLQILITSLIFSYLSFPIGAFLNACNKQVIQTTIVGVVMVVNIILNLFLIPHYGIVGAASAAFIGNLFLTVFGYLVVPKITKISHWFIFKSLLQILLSAGVMGLAVWYTNLYTSFFIAIVAGIVVYALMLYFTRTVTKSQLTEAFELVRK